METRERNTADNKHGKQFKKRRQYLGHTNHYKMNKKGFSDKRSEKARYEYMKLLKKERRKPEAVQPSYSSDESDSVTLDEEQAKSRQGKEETDAYKQHPQQSAGGYKTKSWRGSTSRFRGEDDQKREHMFSKAQKKFQKKKQEKQEQKEEHLLKMEKQNKALSDYKDRKKKKFLMLCKKTRKGQPIMKHQMNFLLEKIKKQVGES